MSTERTLEIVSTSLSETLRIAAEMGRRFRGGEVIELVSDLGGGKTSFVRGLAKGMGSVDTVRSPSFTLGNEYRADSLTLYHLDFYRLIEPGIMKDELQEILADPHAVVAIEWAEIVEEVLPEDRVSIKIKATGEEERKISIACPEKLNYLIENT